MGIGSLDPNVPAGTAKASGGAAELRAIKAEVKASFPQLTAGSDIVTRTAAQINNAPDKTAAETISGNWNHTGTLKVGGVDVSTQTVVPAAYEPAISPKLSAFNRDFAGSGSATTVARSDHAHSTLFTPEYGTAYGTGGSLSNSSGGYLALNVQCVSRTAAVFNTNVTNNPDSVLGLGVQSSTTYWCSWTFSGYLNTADNLQFAIGSETSPPSSGYTPFSYGYTSALIGTTSTRTYGSGVIRTGAGVDKVRLVVLLPNGRTLTVDDATISLFRIA